MGLFYKPEPVPQPSPAKPVPPTLEEIHAQASGASAYAKGVFQDAIEELIDANARFDDVEMRATAEIDRLTQLRDDAAAQRRANCDTVNNLQALIGQ